MSYEKKVAAGEVPATIVFYYLTDTIFNSVQLRSVFRARSVKDQGGVSQLDDVSISPDEKSFIVEVLAQAMYDIFSAMFKMTDTVTENTITVNALYTPTAGVEKLYSTGKIKNNAAYNASVLQTIDKKIENCIRYFILTEWYVVCGMGDDAKINAGKYQEYLRDVKNLTFQLRKPLIS